MLQFALAIFLGAFLLFQVQPIIARCLLPWFGGTPAVWTTCMLFFQVLLLGGYAYAHWLVTKVRPARQAAVQGLLLALSLVVTGLLAVRWHAPLIPDDSWKPASPDFPIARLVILLAVTVGLPYFVLSTTSPLLQAWFSRARPGVSPYRLYTLSNTGSLLALLSYPFLIEPALPMRAQAGVWAGGYLAFTALYALCALRTPRAAAAPAASEGLPAADAAAPDEPAAPQPQPQPQPGRREWLTWIGLPALASALLLAVTNQVCQEIAVIPFLWILPLSLYLLTFIICFDSPRWYSRDAYLLPLLLILPLVAIVILRVDFVEVKLQIPVYCAALFLCCMFCHGELVARKPSPRHLTAFYLAVSVGGALGGLFVAVVAPLIFRRFYELHVSLTLCWALGLYTLSRWRVLPRLLRVPLAVVLAGSTFALPVWSYTHKDDPGSRVLLAARSFYGVFRVDDEYRNSPEYHRHKLQHGGTIHGLQYLAARYRRAPLSYYTKGSGLGLAFECHPRRLSPPGGRPLRVAVVGLGTGTIAVYGRTGDYFRFYEINPQIRDMALNPRYFSYLSDTTAKVEVAMGDARLSLERELRDSGSQQYDIIALDAFSSDAIPAHLLTREAFALYLEHLRKPDGVIVVHTSNRSLDLPPIAFGLADYYHLSSALIENRPDATGCFTNDWVLVTPSERFLQHPWIRGLSAERPPDRHLRLWTDDYYNLYQILK